MIGKASLDTTRAVLAEASKQQPTRAGDWD